jgi:hypothetical protein
MRCLVKPTTMKIYPTTAKIEMGFILEYGHLVVLTVDASLLTANAACRIMETKTSNTAMFIILCYASVCVKQLFTKYS